MIEITAQSARLKQFIDHTGMTVSQFGKQCGFASASTLHNVIAGGKTPSQKVLEKIINRFPQLNYDWIVLGYGEMIVKGFQNREVSTDSLQKSTQSSFGSIQDSLENHDFSLNELAKSVEKALVKVDNISNNLLKTSQQIFQTQEKAQLLMFEKIDNKIASLDALQTKLIIDLKDKEHDTRKAVDDRITKLDEQRRLIWSKEIDKYYVTFDKFSIKTKEYLENLRQELRNDLKKDANLLINEVLEALKKGFSDVTENQKKLNLCWESLLKTKNFSPRLL